MCDTCPRRAPAPPPCEQAGSLRRRCPTASPPPVAALLLREMIAFDLFHLAHNLRGMIGTNSAEFNTRLLHVAGVAMLAACYGRFD